MDDKSIKCRELADVIINQQFCWYGSFVRYVQDNYDDSYLTIVRSNKDFFMALVKGINFKKTMRN